MKRFLALVALLVGTWFALPASTQTTIANNAADMAGKIVMVADSATGRTVTNLFTFDRGAAVPFAVGASSLKVTNFDADKLDGLDSVRYKQTTVATTSTGTQNNFDPSGAIAAGNQIVIIYANPATALTITGFAAGAFDGQLVKVVNTTAGVTVSFQHQNVGSTASGRFINTVTSGDTPTSTGGHANYVYDTTATRWRLVEHEQGAWITFVPTTTSASGVWTIDNPGDITTSQYYLKGRTLSLAITYVTTTTSLATANIGIGIPGGFTANKQAFSVIREVETATDNRALWLDQPGTQFMTIQLSTGNISALVNQLYIEGEIFFDVT